MGHYLLVAVELDKTDYARKIATASGMTYLMMPSSKTSSFFKFTKSEA